MEPKQQHHYLILILGASFLLVVLFSKAAVSRAQDSQPETPVAQVVVGKQAQPAGRRAANRPLSEARVSKASSELEASGAISGTVTADKDGLPLPDITVEVYAYPGPSTAVNSDVTNADGSYEVGGLATGTYKVRFMDFLTGTFLGEFFDNIFSDHDSRSAAEIPVVDGQVTANIDAALSEPSQISGRVTAQDSGAVLEEIWVLAYYFDGASWEMAKGADTVADGTYLIEDLRQGTYRVRFSDSEGQYATEFFDNVPSLELASDVAVSSGEETIDIDAALAVRGRITGTVTNGTEPLSDIVVDLYRWNGTTFGWSGYTATDASGHYEFSGLEDGIFRVKFWDPGRGFYMTEFYDDAPDLDSATDVIVTAGTTASGIDAELIQWGRITGAVTDGTNPIPNVHVRALQWNGDNYDGVSFTETDSTGSYHLSGLTTGIYRVWFHDSSATYVDEYYDDAPDLETAIDVSVTAGLDTPGIDAVLSEPGKITGVVTDGHNPLPDVYVRAYRWSDSSFVYTALATTNASGYYELADLESGTYRVHFDCVGYVPEYYDNAADLQSATDIDVTVGSISSGIDAVLAEYGQISGTVTGGGSGLFFIEVTAYHLDGSDYVSGEHEYTDSSGQYTISNLPPGTYRIGFSDPTWSYYPEFYDDSPTLEGGTDIFVGSASTVDGIDAILTGSGYIDGRVTDKYLDIGLPGIDVLAYSLVEGEWQVIGRTSTYGDGRYEIQLPVGTYRVRFESASGLYIGEYYPHAEDLADAMDIVVEADVATRGIDAELKGYSYISGVVTAEEDGSPLPGIDIVAYRLDGDDWLNAGTAITAADGGYRISNLISGAYHRVGFFDHTNYRYLTEYYDNSADFEDATSLELFGSVDPATNINAALTHGPHSPFFACAAGTGNSATIDIPSTVNLLGALSLRPGDEIAVYSPDGSFCAGFAMWQGDDLTLIAWGDDGSTPEQDGLADGEEMAFRIWDHTHDVIFEYITPAFLQGDGQYAPDTVHQLSALEGVVAAQDIQLLAGWNTIASYLLPMSSSMPDILGEIESETVLIKNGSGQVYWPAQGIDDIAEWDVRAGYQIFLTAPATLSLTGAPLSPSLTPLSLAAGWNLVSYLSGSPMPVDHALHSISGQLLLVKNWAGKVYWPAYGVDQIGELQPGEGYQIYMTDEGTLIYPEN